ncbi:ATP-binding cassette domain-containing protein [uncultured Oscillibacter sp.]|uniref:cell division ATP-binding protein FtsE n=1 Tax=uncultured Oscillibacter sp. TaxID=876091 RepID=UPI0025E70D9A|nr:ATP-binding cassette domain-containing protein [uncultured Oscillibacter sp.]
MPTITLENVTKRYKLDRRQQKENKGKKFEVGVENVDLTIKQGEFVFVVGSSGAGKTTLLDLISGKVKPDKGSVCLDKKDLGKLIPWSQNRMAILFGKVQQEHSLIRKMTVEENLWIAAQVGRRRLESGKHVEMRVKKVLGLVGMRGVENRYPVEMSIGECRRVELARALINSPPILVLDEITANLDDDNIWDMFQLLQEVNRMGTTVIMATHASRYVNIMRRRVVTLVDGKIFGDVEKGRYGDVV